MYKFISVTASILEDMTMHPQLNERVDKITIVFLNEILKKLVNCINMVVPPLPKKN